MTKKCDKKCEVYSRVVGFYRPVQNWNMGKKEEFDNRKAFNLYKAYEEKGIHISDGNIFVEDRTEYKEEVHFEEKKQLQGVK